MHESRNQHEIDCSQRNSESGEEEQSCHPPWDEKLHAAKNHTQLQAELSLAWEQMQIVASGIQVPQTLPIGSGDSFHYGSDDPCERQDGEKRHLKPGIEQRLRIHN